MRKLLWPLLVVNVNIVGLIWRGTAYNKDILTFIVHWGAFATYLLAAQKSMFLLHGCQQFLPCVTLGNNKLVTKGVPCVCGTVGVGESTTHCCPRGPGTSLAFTCRKSECPAQARIGGAGVKGGGWGGCITKNKKTNRQTNTLRNLNTVIYYRVIWNHPTVVLEIGVTSADAKCVH